MDEENKKEVSIEELIKVFQEIDGRIKMLHKDSSDVFLQLNRFLKDYHKKYGIITGNVSRIFDAITGTEGKGFLKEFERVFGELKSYKDTAESEYEKSKYLVKEIRSKVNYFMVMLRNFKQDLTTLKFLTTNYRLLSNSGPFDESSLEFIASWEDIAIRLRKGIQLLNHKLEDISARTDIILSGLEEFTGESLKTIFQYNDDLNSTNTVIIKKSQESEFHFPVLKEKMDNSRNSIGNIITHIQYHDIIRQKIEHIQSTHQKIIKDLENNEISDGPSEDLVEKRFSMISDIAGLQSAQLILISKEYQKALEVISQNFQTIANDLTSVSTLSNEFSYEADDSDKTIIHKLRDRMDKGVMMMDSFNFASFNREIRLLTESIMDLFKDARMLIMDPVEELNAMFLSEKEADLKDDNVDKSNSNIAFQLSNLIRDIVEKKNDLEMDSHEILNMIKCHQESLVGSEIGSELEREQIRIMVSITKMLDRLDDENKELDELLSQNFNLNSDIVIRLKETIEQADYYELFDSVLTEVIEKLNSINHRLGKGSQAGKSYGNINNLKEIEALYTVASERVVHEHVISGKNGEDISDDDLENDDDLELF
ncbi:MAG: hypothetical protein ACOCWA_09490 [Bacteroidota bacterium]